MNWDITANFSEIKDFLKEYAFNRICSAFKVGPQIKPQPNFDIVCY
jgi:hypothetical protein